MSASKKLIQASAGVGGGDFYPYTIDNSVRIQGTSSKYLSRSTALSSSPTDAQKLSFSCWIKLNKISPSGLGYFFLTMSSGYPEFAFYDYSGYSTYGEGSWQFQDYRPTPNPRYLMRADSISKQRDFSAWYHLYIVVDTTLSTGSDRYKLYLNGVPIPYTTTDQPAETPQNTDWHLFTNTNSAWGMYISPALATNSTYGHDFYLAEAHAVDGTAYDISKFGEFKNGVWIPVEPSGISYGNGGFYLDFADSSDLGKDVSGNGNHYTSIGLTSSDQVTDTPTNSFATLNPLAVTASTVTLSDGNLRAVTPAVGGGNATGSFAIPSSGKWYFEFTGVSVSNGMCGLWNYLPNEDYAYQAGANGVLLYDATGVLFKDSASSISYGASYGADVIGCAIDVDGGTVTFYKNNSSQGAIIYDATGMFPVITDGSSGSGVTYDINFGQLGFTYTPPTDFLALCTANLPEPTIGPNSATITSEVFAPILYTGNGTSQSISTLEFQPDFTWIKNRDAADNHMLFDAVRGATKYSNSNTTNAEATDVQSLSSFNSNGFSVGNNVAVNTNTEDYVAWNWKANGSGVSNTDGATASTVSVNTDAGFSIVTYTGTGSVTTVGHGLGVTPNFIIVKARDEGAGYNWCSYSSMLGPTYNTGGLDVTSAADAHPNYWANTAPTSSVFTVSTYGVVNDNGGQMLAYCFAEIEGFSSFGKYTGNGSADGPMIYTGMRPAWVMIKKTNGTGNWDIFDEDRDTYNVVDLVLYPNLANAEQSFGSALDFLSNGFKLRSSANDHNASGGTYVYMAFAENPFKYSNAR